MASVGSEDGDVGFQIAPMVDVVFVLMLYFMASAGAQIVEKELSVNLPGGVSANRAAAQVNPPIIIQVIGDGRVVLVAKDSVFLPADKDLNGLREYLANDIVDRFGADKSPVIIRPEPDARQERIMDVLNAAAVSGITKLTFG